MGLIDRIRAPLFVPANRPERFEKASLSGADAVILDLEDAVVPEARPAARAALRTDFTDLPVIVRINGAQTPDHAPDLAALRAVPRAAVMLAKSESAVQISALRVTLGREIPLIALIETARGLAAAREIAAAPGVARLAFGSVDLCADLGCANLREALLPARGELVLASRLAGIAPPIDGVTVQLADPQLCQGDAAHARDLGMGGKLCIHPKQVDPVLGVFAPDDAEIAWARRVLEAGDGVLSLDGQMVDEPVRLRARAILSAHENTINFKEVQ